LLFLTAFHDFLWTSTESSIEYLYFVVQTEIAFPVAFLLPHCNFSTARHARFGSQMHNHTLGIDAYTWWRFFILLCISSIIDQPRQSPDLLILTSIEVVHSFAAFSLLPTVSISDFTSASPSTHDMFSWPTAILDIYTHV